MGFNENERPAASGLDEIFKNGAISGAGDEPSGSGASDASGGSSASGGQGDAQPSGEARQNGEGDQSRRRDRNRRRGRRRGRSPGGQQNAAQGEPSSDERGADEAVEGEYDRFDEDVADIDPDDVGAGGFGYVPGSYSEVVMTTSAPETVEVVGVRFKDAGKSYYFAPGAIALKKGDNAVVETSRGLEFGTVSIGNTRVPVSMIVPPLRPVIRAATEADCARYAENAAKEKEAFGVCLAKIGEHGLEMKLIDAEYTFDQSKLTFYFSADGRVDFRELVKDLAGVFRTRIELRQIGIRDEAKLVGGLGVCGRPFCCSTFLSDFVQVSIKMAKEQNLSLNSAKISGSCGRLMCCLRFEHETYADEIKKTPPVGSRVKTADGIGVVTETSPLRGRIKVRFGDETNQIVREFDRGDVTVIPKNKPEPKAEDAGGE